MEIDVSICFKIIVTRVINENNNTNYKSTDISNIMFTLTKIIVWMNDGNRFDVKCNILSSIENK